MALKKRKATAGSTQERMRALREKTSRDANRIVSMSNKMAGDLQNAHGTEESVTIKNLYRGLIYIALFYKKHSLYRTKKKTLYIGIEESVTIKSRVDTLMRKLTM